MKITLKNLPKLSTNEIYAGIHYRERKRHKDLFAWLTIDFKKITPFKDRVDLEFKFYFKKSPLDSSNCSYMGKLIEDCLVLHGVLPDDKTKFVRKFSCESEKGSEDLCELYIRNANFI